MKVAQPSAELVRLIGAQPEIMRTICTFNENPADYIDESRRREFFPPRMGGAVWECASSRRHLSSHILNRIGGAPCLEAHRPEWPIALMERDRIDRLARHVAAALVGARVRRCVSRAEVLKWREWLTPEAHEFALTRAGLLPQVPDAGDVAVEGDEASSALQLGHSWIVAASRRWPDAIARRFILKLPAGKYSNADAIDGALASKLVTSVITNLESRWVSSFPITRA